MPFRRGRSGNPRGRPKGAKDKAPRSFRTLAREVVAEYDADLKRALLEGCTGKHAYRYLAILASLERQQVELGGEDGGPVLVQFVDAE